MKVEAPLLATLSLAMVIAGFAAAVSPGDQLVSLLEEGEYPPKVPVGPALADLGLVLAGTGVASNSTADLPLTLMVERTRLIRPSHAENLFDKLGRIDAFVVGGSSFEGSDYEGHMLLSDRPYLLGEIEISGGEEVSELEADVLKKTSGGGEEDVGRFYIKTERRERLWDGEGVLSIEDDVIRGDYKVILGMTPQAERRSEEVRIVSGSPPDISTITSSVSNTGKPGLIWK
ncbi:MAG: hypothetical protein WCY97_01045 [Methanothrix sp.]|jgi:hypothetical protein|uniref:Uncharacterized protein n=1 Tax=Methanothrix harundinacea TaxID=301375 RepID=A0A101FW98_9EURY|nr:MAG: hypothetical protein APR56_14020 [Methanosaeta sp. SDB]KUK45570.1 MAG: hypothetical protein XD72_0044 [Methanothrix harundinacea]MDD3710197.1 hypothetical protein [Methanothrix sp.]MDI9398143.1 hypothetical protein [Euryarchaeota archaeon]KUK96798.1 MAG: hypothetical protein XE07_0884 [Methanothrix harundinacea]